MMALRRSLDVSDRWRAAPFWRKLSTKGHGSTIASANNWGVYDGACICNLVGAMLQVRQLLEHKYYSTSEVGSALQVSERNNACNKHQRIQKSVVTGKFSPA